MCCENTVRDNDGRTDNYRNNTNLSKIDYAVDEIVDRVINIETTKFDKNTANDIVKSVVCKGTEMEMAL